MSHRRCHAVRHSPRPPDSGEWVFDLVRWVGLSGLQPLTFALFRASRGLGCGRERLRAAPLRHERPSAVLRPLPMLAERVSPARPLIAKRQHARWESRLSRWQTNTDGLSRGTVDCTSRRYSKICESLMVTAKVSGGLPAGFSRFWWGEAVAGFGSAVTVLALQTLVVVTLQGSAVQVGWLNSARWLPYLVLGLVVGALVDRVRRRPR